MCKIAVTNNSLVFETMSGKGVFSDIVYNNFDYANILKLAKDKVKKGFILLTHPFIGCPMPLEQPYRTLILKYGEGTIDFNSLNILNYAIKKIKEELSNPKWIWSVDDLLDFRKIDLVVTECWLRKAYNLS